MNSKIASRVWLILGIMAANLGLNLPMSGIKDIVVVAVLGWACSFCLGKFIETMKEKDHE